MDIQVFFQVFWDFIFREQAQCFTDEVEGRLVLEKQLPGKQIKFTSYLFVFVSMVYKNETKRSRHERRGLAVDDW